MKTALITGANKGIGYEAARQLGAKGLVWAVVEPDGDVDVIVGASDRPDVEVDCPAAEQPVVDAAAGKELVRLSERRELLRRVANTTCHVQNRRRR